MQSNLLASFPEFQYPGHRKINELLQCSVNVRVRQNTEPWMEMEPHPCLFLLHFFISQPVKRNVMEWQGPFELIDQFMPFNSERDRWDVCVQLVSTMRHFHRQNLSCSDTHKNRQLSSHELDSKKSDDDVAAPNSLDGVLCFSMEKRPWIKFCKTCALFKASPLNIDSDLNMLQRMFAGVGITSIPPECITSIDKLYDYTCRAYEERADGVPHPLTVPAVHAYWRAHWYNERGVGCAHIGDYTKATEFFSAASTALPECVEVCLNRILVDRKSTASEKLRLVRLLPSTLAGDAATMALLVKMHLTHDALQFAQCVQTRERLVKERKSSRGKESEMNGGVRESVRALTEVLQGIDGPKNETYVAAIETMEAHVKKLWQRLALHFFVAPYISNTSTDEKEKNDAKEPRKHRMREQRQGLSSATPLNVDNNGGFLWRLVRKLSDGETSAASEGVPTLLSVDEGHIGRPSARFTDSALERVGRGQGASHGASHDLAAASNCGFMIDLVPPSYCFFRLCANAIKKLKNMTHTTESMHDKDFMKFVNVIQVPGTGVFMSLSLTASKADACLIRTDTMEPIAPQASMVTTTEGGRVLLGFIDGTLQQFRLQRNYRFLIREMKDELRNTPHLMKCLNEAKCFDVRESSAHTKTRANRSEFLSLIKPATSDCYVVLYKEEHYGDDNKKNDLLYVKWLGPNLDILQTVYIDMETTVSNLGVVQNSCQTPCSSRRGGCTVDKTTHDAASDVFLNAFPMARNNELLCAYSNRLAWHSAPISLKATEIAVRRCRDDLFSPPIFLTNLKDGDVATAWAMSEDRLTCVCVLTDLRALVIDSVAGLIIQHCACPCVCTPLSAPEPAVARVPPCRTPHTRLPHDAAARVTCSTTSIFTICVHGVVFFFHVKLEEVGRAPHKSGQSVVAKEAISRFRQKLDAAEDIEVRNSALLQCNSALLQLRNSWLDSYVLEGLCPPIRRLHVCSMKDLEFLHLPFESASLPSVGTAPASLLLLSDFDTRQVPQSVICVASVLRSALSIADVSLGAIAAHNVARVEKPTRKNSVYSRSTTVAFEPGTGGHDATVGDENASNYETTRSPEVELHSRPSVHRAMHISPHNLHTALRSCETIATEFCAADLAQIPAWRTMADGGHLERREQMRSYINRAQRVCSVLHHTFWLAASLAFVSRSTLYTTFWRTMGNKLYSDPLALAIGTLPKTEEESTMSLSFAWFLNASDPIPNATATDGPTAMRVEHVYKDRNLMQWRQPPDCHMVGQPVVNHSLISCIACTDGGNLVLITTYHGNAELWRLMEDESSWERDEIWDVHAHAPYVISSRGDDRLCGMTARGPLCAIASARGGMCVTAGNCVKLWSTSCLELLNRMTFPEAGPAEHLFYSENCRVIMAANAHGACVWRDGELVLSASVMGLCTVAGELKSRRKKTAPVIVDASYISAAYMSRDGKYVVLCVDRECVIVLVSDGDERPTPTAGADGDGSGCPYFSRLFIYAGKRALREVNYVACSNDGQLLVQGENTLQLWDVPVIQRQPTDDTIVRRSRAEMSRHSGISSLVVPSVASQITFGMETMNAGPEGCIAVSATPHIMSERTTVNPSPESRTFDKFAESVTQIITFERLTVRPKTGGNTVVLSSEAPHRTLGRLSPEPVGTNVVELEESVASRIALVTDVDSALIKREKLSPKNLRDSWRLKDWVGHWVVESRCARIVTYDIDAQSASLYALPTRRRRTVEYRERKVVTDDNIVSLLPQYVVHASFPMRHEWREFTPHHGATFSPQCTLCAFAPDNSSFFVATGCTFRKFTMITPWYETLAAYSNDVSPPQNAKLALWDAAVKRESGEKRTFAKHQPVRAENSRTFSTLENPRRGGPRASVASATSRASGDSRASMAFRKSIAVTKSLFQEGAHEGSGDANDARTTRRSGVLGSEASLLRSSQEQLLTETNDTMPPVLDASETYFGKNAQQRVSRFSLSKILERLQIKEIDDTFEEVGTDDSESSSDSLSGGKVLLKLTERAPTCFLNNAVTWLDIQQKASTSSDDSDILRPVHGFVRKRTRRHPGTSSDMNHFMGTLVVSSTRVASPTLNRRRKQLPALEMGIRGMQWGYSAFVDSAEEPKVNIATKKDKKAKGHIPQSSQNRLGATRSAFKGAETATKSMTGSLEAEGKVIEKPAPDKLTNETVAAPTTCPPRRSQTIDFPLRGSRTLVSAQLTLDEHAIEEDEQSLPSESIDKPPKRVRRIDALALPIRPKWNSMFVRNYITQPITSVLPVDVVKREEAKLRTLRNSNAGLE